MAVRNRRGESGDGGDGGGGGAGSVGTGSAGAKPVPVRPAGIVSKKAWAGPNRNKLKGQQQALHAGDGRELLCPRAQYKRSILGLSRCWV